MKKDIFLYYPHTRVDLLSFCERPNRFVILSLLLTFFILFQVRGQKFQDGYIIKKSGDTLRGNVLLRKEKGCLKGIYFEDKNTYFRPAEIKGTGASNVHYISASVAIDKSPARNSIYTDTVLLEILLRGRIGLLAYRDEFEKEHFFIGKARASVKELPLHLQLLEDGIRVQRTELYKDVLKKELTNCSFIHSKIDRLPYNRVYLKRLFEEYDQCLAGNFESAGYIVRNSGDTLRGQVSLKKKNGSLQSVQFKGESEPEELLGPLDIKAIGQNGIQYVSFIVSSDKSPKHSIVVRDTVLLEVLVRGNMSLLFYVDEFEKNHFYIEMKNGGVEELVLKIIPNEDGVHFKKIELYKGMLKTFFPGCTSLFPEIEKTPYERNKLQNLFVKCYQCENKNLTPISIAEKERTKTEFGFMSGFSFSNIKFNGHYIDGTVPRTSIYNFKESASFTGGLFLNLKFPRISDQFSLDNEVQFKKVKTSSQEIGETQYIRSKGFVDEKFLRYNFLMSYKFSKKEIAPFIHIGMTNSFLFQSNDYVKFVTTITNPVINYQPLLRSIRKYEQGFIVGVGMTSRQMQYELRFERSNGTMNEASLNSRVTSFYLLLSYKIVKSIKQ
jgi:hypothetical protein